MIVGQMQVMLTGICSKALVCSLEPRINLGGHEIRLEKNYALFDYNLLD